MLGRTATVVVSVPMGAKRADGSVQTLNFGQVKGFTQKGGAPLDAYIVGMDKPVHSFTGPVLAVLYREDRTPCWIVASRRTVMVEPQLRRLLAACEKEPFKLSCRYPLTFHIELVTRCTDNLLSFARIAACNSHMRQFIRCVSEQSYNLLVARLAGFLIISKYIISRLYLLNWCCAL